MEVGRQVAGGLSPILAKARAPVGWVIITWHVAFVAAWVGRRNGVWPLPGPFCRQAIEPIRMPQLGRARGDRLLPLGRFARQLARQCSGTLLQQRIQRTR